MNGLELKGPCINILKPKKIQLPTCLIVLSGEDVTRIGSEEKHKVPHTSHGLRTHDG